MFTLRFTKSAWKDLGFLRKSEQQTIVGAVEEQLVHEPSKETRNRKPLRPDDLSKRNCGGEFRVFYDVAEHTKKTLVKAVGWKEHNKLFIRGKDLVRLLNRRSREKTTMSLAEVTRKLGLT